MHGCIFYQAGFSCAPFEAKYAAAGAGMTALHLATVKGSAAAVSALLRQGASADAQITGTSVTPWLAQGSTALHIAAARGYIGCVSILLEYQSTIPGDTVFVWHSIHPKASAIMHRFMAGQHSSVCPPACLAAGMLLCSSAEMMAVEVACLFAAVGCPIVLVVSRDGAAAHQELQGAQAQPAGTHGGPSGPGTPAERSASCTQCTPQAPPRPASPSQRYLSRCSPGCPRAGHLPCLAVRLNGSTACTKSWSGSCKDGCQLHCKLDLAMAKYGAASADRPMQTCSCLFKI